MSSKLDKNYISVYLFLRGAFPNIFEITEEEYKKYKNLSISSQLKGAFQPLADMAKDAADTFKPYRSRYYVKRDALQPFYGIGNVLKGVLYLIALLPLLFLGLGFCIFTEQTSKLPLGAAMLLSWFIDGILSIFVGITQIAFTPLGWLKMATRGIILAFTKEENLLVENRQGIRKLVAEAQSINSEYVNTKNKEACLNNLYPIAELMHTKYSKGLERGEDTGLNDDAKAISGDTGLARIGYLKLFGFVPDVTLEQIEQPKKQTASRCNIV